MTIARSLTLAFAALALGPAAALAQLPAPNAAGISTGHTHLTVPNAARHTEIWKLLGAEHLGGDPGMLRVPGMYILLFEREPGAPSIETSADHLGFTVRDYAMYKAKLEAVNASVFYENDEDGQILADLPDGVRIEILRDEEQDEPIRFHHLHLSASEPEALREWYVDAFGAEPGERRGLPSAVVPGGRVDILPARGEEKLPSRGNAIDHIGFEVDDIDAFAAKMRELGIELDMEPTEVESIGLTIAFVTDPEGTYIEITEGLRGRE